jgi:carbamoyl-phosphate synthase large subunit
VKLEVGVEISLEQAGSEREGGGRRCPHGRRSGPRPGGRSPSARRPVARSREGNMTFTVLRTGAGSPVAPFVIRTLQEIPDVRVVAVDCDPLSCGFAFADRHHVVPRVDAEGFLEAMLEVCRQESVDLLLPDLDEELSLLSAARDRFLALRTRVVVSAPDVISECTDKYRTFRLFRNLGIPTPETWLPEEVSRGRPLRFPVIVKPRNGRGSSDVFKAQGREELEYVLERVTNPVVQEFVNGPEYTIDTMSDLEGRFLYCSVRERLATESGISVKGRTVVHNGISEFVRQIVDALPVVGPGCVQGIESKDGIRFTEINPRLAGGVALSVAAGAPVLADLVRLARGDQATGPASYRGKLLMLRFWENVFVEEEKGNAVGVRTAAGGWDGAARHLL